MAHGGTGATGTGFKGPVESANGFIADAGGMAVTGGIISDTITLGGGTTINTIVRGTVAIDPASIASAAVGETSVTITGATVGDTVVLSPPTAGLTAGLGLLDARVSAANTVKVRIANLSGGSVDEPSGTWTYMLIR